MKMKQIPKLTKITKAHLGKCLLIITKDEPFTITIEKVSPSQKYARVRWGESCERSWISTTLNKTFEVLD